MKAWHPTTNELYYFVDKCLPFGHCFSCALYQRFSDALSHLIKYILHQRHRIVNTPLSNYLDDFLLAALAKQICDLMLKVFLEMCKFIGVLVSEEKTVLSSTLMVFLGILLEGEHCRAIRLSMKQCMVEVNTWVFILRRYKWHITQARGH